MDDNCRLRQYHILLVIRWPVGGIRTFLRYVYKNLDLPISRITIAAPNTPELKILLNDLEDYQINVIASKIDITPWEFFRFVFRVIVTGKYDLVHSQGLTAGICSIIPCFISKRPHLMTLHDVFTERQFQGIMGLAKKAFLNATMPFVDTIHTVSHDARDNLLEYIPSLKCKNNKVVAIPNGVEVRRFMNAEPINLRQKLGLPENSFLIGFLGRFMSQKGFVYLVEAIKILYEKYELSKLPIVLAFSSEDGFFREEKKEVERKGLDHVIRFLPFTPNVAPVLKSLDIVVMPSLWEACGLLAMEAMVSGVPVIGTDCIGLREVLKDTPGIMIPKRNSLALADALFKEMTFSTRERSWAFQEIAATRFDVEKQARELKNLIRMMLTD